MQKTAATMAPDRPQVEIIGVSSGLGGCDPACGRGPAALEAAGLTAWLRNREIAADWYDTIAAPIAATIAADENPANVLPARARLCGDLKTLIEGVIERDTSFAVLGGDHSCAVGTWSGAAASLRPAGDLGLV